MLRFLEWVEKGSPDTVHSFTKTDKVAGKDVELHVMGGEQLGAEKGHYHIGFSVNGLMNRSPEGKTSTGDSRKILTHVIKHIRKLASENPHITHVQYRPADSNNKLKRAKAKVYKRLESRYGVIATKDGSHRTIKTKTEVG